MHEGSVDLGAPPGGRAFHFVHLPASLEISKMRESLGERETLLVRRPKDGEERADYRYLVAFRVTDRVERRSEPVVVVREDLIDAARKVIERVAVRRKHARHRQRTDRSQRVEKIAQRVVARIRIQPDVRRY